MTPPLPAYRRFLALFNAQEFWEAHEALESLWREDHDPFKKGLILFAAAHVHVQRNNPSGCRKCLLRAIHYLEPYAPRHGDLDVDRILARARANLELLDRLPPGQPLAAAIPMIRLEPQGWAL